MVILSIIILAVGLWGLTKGADLFVDAASSLAKRLRVPAAIIGLTIVALGTSAPELAVSTVSAMQGANELALSNVVGSNIFNLLVVLGACAVFCPLPVERGIIKRDFSVSIVATIVVILVSCATAFSGKLQFSEKGMYESIGLVGRIPAMILVAAFLIYMGLLISEAKRHPTEEQINKGMTMKKSMVFLILGLVLIVGGGEATVYGAKNIARAFGMSETLIGLTIVAMGTSLPELMTSIVAAKKQETELAVGNAIGSNLFNLMFILGISASIRPIGVNLASVFDMMILLGISILTMVFALTGKKINRIEGMIMLLVYLADLIFAIVR